MKKVYLKEQLKFLNEYPIEVIDSIGEMINVLDESYGGKRDIEYDLGGYVVIAENIVDIEILKQDNKPRKSWRGRVHILNRENLHQRTKER